MLHFAATYTCIACPAPLLAGKRGLEALSHLDLQPSPTPTSKAGSTPTGQSLAGLWAPGSANLGSLQGLGNTADSQNPEALPGLMLLQGMVVTGAQGHRREQYSRAASRGGGGGSGPTGNKTAGIGEALG